jgi:hypothetical protein
MATHVYLRDGRALSVDVPLRQLEVELRRSGPHVVECVTVTESGVTYGPSRVLVKAQNIRLLVDPDARRGARGWDNLDDD